MRENEAVFLGQTRHEVEGQPHQEQRRGDAPFASEVVPDDEVQHEDVEQGQQQRFQPVDRHEDLAVAAHPQGEEHGRQHRQALGRKEHVHQHVDHEGVADVDQQVDRVVARGVQAEELVLRQEGQLQERLAEVEADVPEHGAGVRGQGMGLAQDLHVVGVPQGGRDQPAERRDRQDQQQREYRAMESNRVHSINNYNLLAYPCTISHHPFGQENSKGRPPWLMR